MSKLAEPIDREIIAAILNALGHGEGTITYGELSERIRSITGREINPHMGFNVALGRIQDLCEAGGTPCLSAVVVNKSQVPGSGFLPYYREKNPEDTRTDDEIISNEQERCSEQRDWSPLLELCGMKQEMVAAFDGEPLDADALVWSRFVPIIDQYEKSFGSFRPEEVYKWEAAKCFQEHWDLDAADFLAMLDASLEKAGNLLSSRMYYAKGMIHGIVENDPEAARTSFRALFDEQIPLAERLSSFSDDMGRQLEALNAARAEQDVHPAKNHYQDVRAMSVYLSLARNSVHYLFKPDLFCGFAQMVGFPYSTDKYQKVVEHDRLCDLILGYLETRRPELIEVSDGMLDDALRSADPKHHLLVQDIIYFTRHDVSRTWAYAPGEQASHWEDLRGAGVMGIGWSEVGDPSLFKTKKDLREALSVAYGKENPANDTDTIWSFVHGLKPGDTVWVRRGLSTVIGRGIVRSNFRFDADRPFYPSVRDVEWEDIEPFEVPGRFSQKTLSELNEKTSVTVSALEELSAEAEANAGWYPPEDEYSPAITDGQWESLVAMPDVFTDDALVALGCLRARGGATTVTELAQSFGRSPNWYQGQAVSLAQRIAGALPAVKPYMTDGQTKWWPILFVGRDQEKGAPGTFVWKLRRGLARALDTVDWKRHPLEEAGCAPTEASGEKSYWWLTASPRIWSLSGSKPGKEQSYTIYTDSGSPRRVHANFLQVKPGDVVVGYEATPVKKVVALCEISKPTDDEKIYFKKIRDLVDPVPYAEIKADEVLSQSQFIKNPNGSLFSLTKEEYDRILELSGEDSPIAPATKSEPYGDADFLEEVYVSERDLRTMRRLLERKRNLILQGAPGTGKTFCARRLAWDIMGERDDGRICQVQFHQSTTYDDMMAGYRPSEGGGFEAVPGEFLRFCDRAARDPERPWFFIIDEINRANISKVFGELLMLIEAGHRGETLRLPLLDRNVSVPENLYLIGMMNTADRGLALIDYALRRRFAFFEMEPAFDNERFIEAIEGSGNGKLLALAQEVRALNAAIADDPSLGSGFRIGHSYFLLGGAVTDDDVRDVIEYELAPLLREYWFDAPDMAESKIDDLRSVL